MVDKSANRATGSTNGLTGTNSPLFDEFTAPTYDEWYAATVASLKGVPFDRLLTKTYEGISLQPLYRQEDAAHLSHQNTMPGQAPFVRGATATGYLAQPWLIAQEISAATPEAFNRAARHDLARGQTAVNLKLDRATCNGLDPDQVEPDTVGVDGVSMAALDDLAAALEGVDLAALPLFVDAGISGLPLLALVTALVRQQGHDPALLQGAISMDPLGMLARQGSLPVALEALYNELARMTHWAENAAPQLSTIAVSGLAYRDAGANAVQELAVTLATGVAYLRAMQERGLEIETVAPRMRFTFTLGNNLFMEIAKLRTARLLWSQIVAAFGGREAAQAMQIHAQSANWNKTLLDPYVNMLRTTTEAFAGAVGGVASMHVAPFDAVYQPSDEFGRRIARNTQLILQEECSLARLIDPAGGSWYVEKLTDQLARDGWALFQEIEAQGGMAAALFQGSIQSRIEAVAAARRANLARRKDVQVGTNMYPNLHEKLARPAPLNAFAERLQRVDQLRGEADSVAVVAALETVARRTLAGSTQLDAVGIVDSAIEAATAGALINELSHALRADAAGGPHVTALAIQRGSEPFETLRQRSDHAAQASGRPQVFLAVMGPLAQHKARADFAQSFFAVGGFDAIYPTGFATADEAAQAALDSGAAAVVICSTDESYPAVVPPLVAHIRAAQSAMPVILAGYPKEQVDALKAAGVDEFIHVRADCHGINVWLQEKLGLL